MARGRIPMITSLLLTGLAMAAPTPAWARDVPVSDAAGLRAAIAAAMAGDVILLADGEYVIDANLRCNASGTAAEPIIVRSVTPLGAHIRSSALEGFVVAGAHWHFEDLEMEGTCAAHSDCEHAWHIVGDADFTIIRGCRAFGFNAHIKSNGQGDPRRWPDDVLIEGNEFWNPGPRMTSNPVTPIDVVGGRRWMIRGNFIHDHEKGMGDRISYAAFLKGNSRDGIFEQNLVVCELMHTGGTRLGLSFGGGGTSPDPICEDGTCRPEHQGGIMRNNIIAHCPSDVGIYVNRCAGCLVAHNTVFDTTGIDVRFVESDTMVIGNLLSGRVRARDMATLVSMGNREMVSASEWDAWFSNPTAFDFGLVDGTEFVDLGTTMARVTDDFCGNARDDGSPDLGAVEFDGDGPCDTTMPGGGVIMPGADAGMASRDAGPPVDGGPLPDGATPGLDSGPRADGGAAPASDGGCACRTSGRGTSAAPTMVLVALLFGALVRRRRRTE